MEKRCTKCGEVKPLEEFYRQRNAKDGRQYRCKQCSNKYARTWKKANPKKCREQVRKWVEANRERHLERRRKWREENLEKIRKYEREYMRKRREERRKQKGAQ